MESIFHEKQEGALCAQHCLNSLLQGPYFTAVDLASFARNLDETERQQLAEGSTDSQEYIEFMKQPSNNMDDSGYFSIQVLCKALEVWNLELVPYNSAVAAAIRDDPVSQTAFICNLQNHWFTIRKLGAQWFNLNSLKEDPELISDTYLRLYLAQLQAEGYSIFIVNGSLPECEANQLLLLCPVNIQEANDFLQFKKAARRAAKGPARPTETAPSVSSSPPKIADASAVRDKRMKYFDKLNTNVSQLKDIAQPNEVQSNEDLQIKGAEEMSDEEMMQMAIAMSMEGVT